MKETIIFKTASTAKEFEDGKYLFKEYVKSLPFVLVFQDIEQELKEITFMYAPPKGALLLAYDDELAVACTGIRKLDGETAELKRMFVEPDYRGQEIAQRLLQSALKIAKDLGYRSIKLDSTKEMTHALALYHTHGFKTTEPYCYNPLPTAVFLKKDL